VKSYLDCISAEPEEGCQRRLPSSFKTFINVLAFHYVRANSKEICEEITSTFFFRKMLISEFLLRFKPNYLEKICGYIQFSFWIPVALAKIYFFRMVLILSKEKSRHRP